MKLAKFYLLNHFFADLPNFSRLQRYRYKNTHKHCNILKHGDIETKLNIVV